MREIAIYPGSFDPLTNGHLDIITRAAEIFDTVIIAVADNPNKKTCFSLKERIAMIQAVIKQMKNVRVEAFKGLLVDYLAKKKAKILVRGLRAVSDFEYEVQMALMNRKLNPTIETILLIPDEKYTFLSSSIVKEIAQLQGNLTGLVPAVVKKYLKRKYSK